MADRTVQILPGGQSAAPYSYTVPASTSFALMAVRALFDGSGAAGNFVPLIQLVSDAGVVMAQRKGDTVTAGASADVTFAPFDRSSSSGGTDPLAVHFNTSPQNGTFLETDTTNGVTISDKGNAFTSGITLESGNGLGGGGQINLTTDDGLVFVGSTDIVDRIGTSGSYQLQNHGGTVILEADGGASVRLVFNGANLISHNLPTADPGISGALWNNAGVVTVSP